MKATDPFGRRWVIQRKHRRNGVRGSAVGTPDLQVLNGTARPVHGAVPDTGRYVPRAEAKGTACDALATTRVPAEGRDGEVRIAIADGGVVGRCTLRAPKRTGDARLETGTPPPNATCSTVCSDVSITASPHAPATTRPQLSHRLNSLL